MQWLPSQRNRHRQNEPRPYSLIDEYFPPHTIPETGDSIPKPSSICPTSPKQESPRPTTSPHNPNRRRSQKSPDFSNIPHSAIKAVKGPSFVLDEPLMRPSSRMTHSTSHSTSNSSKSIKADPFTPSYSSDALPPRTHSPYAPRRPSPLATHAEVPEGGSGGDNNNNNNKPWKARLRRSPSPLAEHFRRFVRRTPPAQSTEFINLYRPLQPPNPGVAVPGCRMDRDVGDGRPVRRMLGRRRTPSPPPGVEGGVPEQVVVGTGDVVDLRSVRKRSSLQSEIKKLLGGKGQGKEKEKERERE
ncbi:uncharacterized protein F4807DRAFT_412037 [Annulohypoxylon truncatum]|uniref:uncharacterized protein n=1 Tax=Annulohypoxylon truncatum TaxID=327061 RepID=UPI002007A59D|nr:uncharacterized protein F4807DRAFT_412037 [Annulohypoxylon truncatum]KAI1212905.1 hypothetical protein F4807DRAFT_412037 [Annulohypoxylon truncatum]